MADYIERKAYVDLFKGEHNLYSWEEIEEFMDSIPSADVAPMEWIPVTERLPDFEGCCLCVRRSYVKPCVRHQEVMYFDFDEKSFRPLFDEVFVADGNVTHWMPLPKPPVLN